MGYYQVYISPAIPAPRWHSSAHQKCFYKKLKNVSCEYNRLNRWNSTLQAAWYIRHVRSYNRYQVCFLWTKRTIWLLILSFTQNIIRACFMFYPYEGYRSVTPLDAARVNRTIFRNHSVHYITLIEGRDYIKHDIIIWHGQPRLHRGRCLFSIKHYIITWYDQQAGCRIIVGVILYSLRLIR